MIRIAHYTGYLLSLVFCIALSNAQAYETGRIALPSQFVVQHHMLLSEPGECLTQLESNEPLTLQNNKLLVESQQLLWAHKLAALCAFNDRNYTSAKSHINVALKVLDPNNIEEHFELLLIKVLVQAKFPEQAQDNDKTLSQARDLLNNFTQLQTPNHQYQIERISGMFYHRNGRSAQALQALLKAKEHAFSSQDSLLNAWAEYRLAEYYLSDKQNQLALTHFYAAAVIVENIPSSSALYLNALSNREMALIYLTKKDFPKALDKQSLAIAASSRLPNPRLKADMLSSLGKINNLKGDYGSAIIPLMNAREFAKDAKSIMLLSRINMYLGEAYSNTQEYELALMHLQSARRQYQLQENPSLELQVLLLLAQLQLIQDEPALAVLQLQKAEDLANTIGLTHRNAEVYRLLALAYEQNDSFENALSEYKVFHDLNQQYEHLSRAAFEDDFKHHVQLMEQGQQLSEVTGLKAELELELLNLSRVSVLAVLSLIFVFLALVFVAYRNFLKGKQITDLTWQLEINPNTQWQELLFHRNPLRQLRTHYQKSGADAHLVALICVEGLRTRNGDPLSQASAPLYFERLTQRAKEQQKNNFEFGHLGLHHALVLSNNHSLNGEDYSKCLIELFEELHLEFGYQAHISVCACPLPFLEKSAEALNDQTMLQILQLSLFNLKKAAGFDQKPNWISLKAQPWTPAAFFGDEIAQDLSNAIDKGLVKARSSVDINLLAW